MKWRRNATLLVLFAATLAGIDCLESLAKDGTISTTACYMALANDLTPLIDAAASDTAAKSAECNAQVEAVADTIRDANVNRSTVGNVTAVRYPSAPGHASVGAKASAGTASAEPMR